MGVRQGSAATRLRGLDEQTSRPSGVLWENLNLSWEQWGPPEVFTEAEVGLGQIFGLEEPG